MSGFLRAGHDRDVARPSLNAGMRKNTLILMLATVLATGGTFTLSGCNEGPGERIGEKLGGDTSGARDKLNPDSEAEKAGKKIDRALDKATD